MHVARPRFSLSFFLFLVVMLQLFVLFFDHIKESKDSHFPFSMFLKLHLLTTILNYISRTWFSAVQFEKQVRNYYWRKMKFHPFPVFHGFDQLGFTGASFFQLQSIRGDLICYSCSHEIAVLMRRRHMCTYKKDPPPVTLCLRLITRNRFANATNQSTNINNVFVFVIHCMQPPHHKNQSKFCKDRFWLSHGFCWFRILGGRRNDTVLVILILSQI